MNTASIDKLIEFMSESHPGLPPILVEYVRQIKDGVEITDKDIGHIRRVLRSMPGVDPLLTDRARAGTQGLAEAIDKVQEPQSEE